MIVSDNRLYISFAAKSSACIDQAEDEEGSGQIPRPEDTVGAESVSQSTGTGTNDRPGNATPAGIQ